jgi:hypothetical protein
VVNLDYFSYNLGLNPKKKKVKRQPIINNRVTLNKTETFHRNKNFIKPTIMKTIGPREIIYGEMALKKRFPSYLERPTQDIDVYSPTPRRDARQAEKALDRRFGGNYFEVRKAQHQGTYKVVSLANDEGYADFTRKPKNVPSDRIGKHRYLKLSEEIKHRERSLRDKDYEWRHGKDRDALNRIRIYMKNRR